MTNSRRRESEELKKARTTWLQARQTYEEKVGLYTDPETATENKTLLLSVAEHTRLISDIQNGHDAYVQALRDEGRLIPHEKH